METVSLHLNRQNLDLANVQADQSCWEDSPKFHILYFTRIFYLFECPAYEQIGEWWRVSNGVVCFCKMKAPSPPSEGVLLYQI